MRDFAQELEEMMVAEAMRLSLAEQGSTVDAAAPVDVVGQVSAPVYISETNDDDDDDDVPLSALVGNMRMVTEEQVEIENGTEAVAATSPTDTAPDPSPQLGASQSHDSNGDTRNAPLT